jgi:hypothetical protein
VVKTGRFRSNDGTVPEGASDSSSNRRSRGFEFGIELDPRFVDERESTQGGSARCAGRGMPGRCLLRRRPCRAARARHVFSSAGAVYMKSVASLSLLVAALTVSGCASIAVTDEAIVDRTAFALGLNKGEFTVSNRVDEGTTTRYGVRTKTGQEYNCFVGGSISVIGRSVSEAICTKKGEPARNPLLR